MCVLLCVFSACVLGEGVEMSSWLDGHSGSTSSFWNFLCPDGGPIINQCSRVLFYELKSRRQQLGG